MKRLVALALLVAACGGASTSPSTLSSATASPAAASTAPSPSEAAPSPIPQPSELGGGPDLTSVGFSTDGSACDSGTSETTFDEGVPIHVVLSMEPALPTGGTVTVAMEKDGRELVERGQTITATEPAPCVWGTLRGLEPGHFRVTYTISPSQMPPASGEFDVTPVRSAESEPDPVLATRAIASLDALAKLAVKGDDLLTANWVIDESEWITDNTAALLAQSGTLKRFFDEHTALLDVVGAGGDQAVGIARLLSLRDEIATEFAMPTRPPSPN